MTETAPEKWVDEQELEIRRLALERALEKHRGNWSSTENVVEDAEKFYRFLKHGPTGD